ncbi:MAG: hypothetical protein KF826_04655 [Xanthobacteraceae bacterium]|nr:hypothetical protein [Xanthobacteraceae bacterium]MBX3533621.1 hypothetical protein [Xanthobacteraceae bacterium]MCW5675736.1 hypothetical protein [Xanthobacteraceae bacterium]MCW5679217.1 hypothetical protein [Xanthobacteraceae bacterium]
MTGWIRLTKTDNRPVDVNLERAHTVLRDERNYSTLITFGPSDSVTVLEAPDEIFGRAAKRDNVTPFASASI